ncbi:MAG: methyltransferase domain-containing protein [Anaerolineae bacterium]|nr:methyltransferase domain-containing protein [Anaerolineae bacterium]
MKWWWSLVRFGFRLLYNELAFTYDWVSRIVSLGAWRCWQRSALKHLPAQGVILELAHGTGDLQIDLHAAGYHTVIGYDLSPYMGRITQRKLTHNGITPRLTRGMAQALPFSNATFDAIVCTFPTPFIFERVTLDELYRVMRPNSRLIIVISGTFTAGGVLIRLLEGLYRITGQRADRSANEILFQQVIDRFQNTGFQARLTREPCQHSEALVILAERR